MTEFNTIGKRTQITVDATPTQNSTNPVQSGGVYTALQGKQDTMTVDSAPTENSTNPVESGGVYTALAAKQATLTFDSAPTQDSVNPVTSGGVYTGLAAKQDALTFDSAPSSSSLNPVTSQGIASALSAKVDTTAMYTTDGANGQTAQNPIALRDFVNSSVATNTANFIATYNVVNLEYPAGTSLTTSATQTDVVNALNLLVSSESISPTNNDYCFVYFDFQDDPGNIDRYDRYKYVVDETVTPSTTTWAYEYTLNNSSFTATQWNAINSGITSGKVTTYDGYATGKIDTAGTKLAKTGTTLNHDTTTRTDTTSTASPAHSDTFTAVDSVTTDTTGHVTAINVKTVTLPASGNTDTLMTQNVSTANNTYPILLCPTANATANQGAKTGIFASGIKANPSTGTITGTYLTGKLSTTSHPNDCYFYCDWDGTYFKLSAKRDSNNTAFNARVYIADISSKLGTATVGSATQPIYLNAGVPTAGTSLKTGAYKNITISTDDPSGGSDGDIWIKYS